MKAGLVAVTIGLVMAAAGCCCTTPRYEPAFWNDQTWLRDCGNVPASGVIVSGGTTVQKCNNCYNYAANKKTNTYALPGRASTANYGQYSARDGALLDGFVLPQSGKCADEVSGDGTVRPCQTKVALFIGSFGEEFDWHFYRQDADGTWSHKPGGAPARNTDESGAVISNPETANRCGDAFCYSQFVGYLCACSDSAQGQGHVKIR